MTYDHSFSPLVTLPRLHSLRTTVLVRPVLSSNSSHTVALTPQSQADHILPYTLPQLYLGVYSPLSPSPLPLPTLDRQNACNRTVS